MANARLRIEWIDEPIIIETDTDGNYSGVLVKNIDRLLAYHRGEQEITYDVVSFSPPIAESTINSSNDVMIVVKEMEADTFFHAKVVVRASPDVGAAPVDKTFYATFRNPRDKK